MAPTTQHRTVSRPLVVNGTTWPQEKCMPTTHRLTDRDRAALGYVAALRAVRLDDVGLLLAALAGRGTQALGARTTRDVVARWQALGLATTEPYPGQGPAIVLPTPRGAALAHLGRPKPPSWTDTPHTLTTAAVAARYLAGAGGAWQSETWLRVGHPKGEHLPDGLWLPPGNVASVAVEVERNGKAADRWASIAANVLGQYRVVHYWLSASTQPAWQRWAGENLTQLDANRIKVYGIEAQGVAR